LIFGLMTFSQSSSSSSRLKRLGLTTGLLVLVLLLALGGYALYLLATENFHTVVTGQLYRSGQMNAAQFSQVIQEYHIKSILNLRGENPTTAWHRAELAAAGKYHVVHYDRSLGSGTPLTLAQMNELVTLMRNAPKPLLVHCNGGADRSGLVAALYCYAIDDETAAQADRQLTIWYGHIPLIRPKVIAMDNSFWRYVTNHAS
jgi:protein tyrosine/serine phosphatase